MNRKPPTSKIIRAILSNPLTYFFVFLFIIVVVVSCEPTNSTIEDALGVVELTPSVTVEPRPGVPTPYPPELLERSAEQTNGIVLMGVTLVMIVVWGTLSVIGRRR